MITYAPTETVMNPDLLGLANEYAEALLDSLTEDNPKQISQELKELANLIDNIDGAREMFASATVNTHRRTKIVERVFGIGADGAAKVSPVIARLLGVLAKNNRLTLITAISDSFNTLLKKRLNVIDVTLRTAVPASGEQIEELEKSLAAMLNITPQIHNVVDDKIIAGMVVQIGDTVYDLSVAGEIDKMVQNIKKES